MKPSRREFVRKGRDALVVGFALYRGVAPVIAWGQTAQPTASTAKPVAPEELFNDVYAELPYHLRLQRDALLGERKAGSVVEYEQAEGKFPL